MSMPKFKGWASAEEFVDAEEAMYRRDREVVERFYHRERKPMQLPVWLGIAAGLAIVGSVLWAVCQVAISLAEWIERF